MNQGNRVVFFLLFSLMSFSQVKKSTLPNAEKEIANYLLQGWNTWNNASYLSHVRMPDGLNLKYKMRKKRGDPRWLERTFMANRFPENIRPQEHAYNGSYTSLIIEWEGARARIQTAHEGDDIIMLYTPIGSTDTVHILLLESGFYGTGPALF